MLEERKQKEIEYYERQAENWMGDNSEEKWEGDFEGFNSKILASYRFCYVWLKNNCSGKKVLDYGCGNGIHSVFLAKCGAQVVGIDLAEKQIEIARDRVKLEGLEEKTSFLIRDCEKTEFPDNSFDIVFDGGTFSSLDIKKVLPEIARILKKNGILIGIETLGHNPIANLKRKLNKISGKRTGWAAEHILRLDDLETAKNYFNKIEVHFFHPISFLALPFLGLPLGKFLLKLGEQLDKILLLFPFLRKLSFKAVFIFSEPKDI